VVFNITRKIVKKKKYCHAIKLGEFA